MYVYPQTAEIDASFTGERNYWLLRSLHKYHTECKLILLSVLEKTEMHIK